MRKSLSPPMHLPRVVRLIVEAQVVQVGFAWVDILAFHGVCKEGHHSEWGCSCIDYRHQHHPGGQSRDGSKWVAVTNISCMTFTKFNHSRDSCRPPGPARRDCRDRVMDGEDGLCDKQGHCRRWRHLPSLMYDVAFR